MGKDWSELICNWKILVGTGLEWEQTHGNWSGINKRPSGLA